MKKVYRKLVSMLLAAVLIIACVPATALGEEGNTGAAKNVSESNNGKYMVYYDSWEAYGHPDSGSVKVGDQPLKDSTEYTFVSGDSIEFKLQSPAEVSGNTPVVEIVVWNNDKEEIFSSKSNDANKLEITGENRDWSVSFTPKTTNFFEVVVWWSDKEYEYSTFGPGEKEFQIEFNTARLRNEKGQSMGTVSVSPDISANSSKEYDRYGVKYNYSQNILSGNSTLPILFQPAEGYYLHDVRIGAYYYSVEVSTNKPTVSGSSLRDTSGNDIPFAINEANGFDFNSSSDRTIIYKLSASDVAAFCDDKNGNTLKYSCDENENYVLNCPVYIEAGYRSTPSMSVYYDNHNEASVSLNGVVVSSNQSVDFVPGKQISFILTPPVDLINEHPVVEVRVRTDHGDVLYRSDDTPATLELSSNGDNTWSFSYTPTYDDFDVQVWWSAYDAFDFDYTKQFQIETNVWPEDGGSIEFSETPDELFSSNDGNKYNFPVSAVSPNGMQITFNIPEGREAHRIEIGDKRFERNSGESEIASGNGLTKDENGTYSYSLSLNEVYEYDDNGHPIMENGEYRYSWLPVRMETAPLGGAGDPDQSGEGNLPENQGDWDKLAENLRNNIFAYGGKFAVSSDTIRTSMARELSERRYGVDYTLSDALGRISAEALETHLTISAVSSNAVSANKIQKPFYTYEIAISANTVSSLDKEFYVSGNVYVLDSDSDFIVKTKTDDPFVVPGVENTEQNEFHAYYAKVSDLEDIQVYGNGAFLNTIMAEDSSVFAGHLTQEHAGLVAKNENGEVINDDTSFPVGSRLVLCKNLKSILLQYDKTAAPWNFVNANAYLPSGDSNNPNHASVFYASNRITIEPIDFVNVSEKVSIRSVKAIGLSESAVTVSDNELSLNTAYDTIPLEVTYSDNSKGYLTLHRVGLDVDCTDVEGAPDDRYSAEDKTAYQENWNGKNTYRIWHGTDQTVRYVAKDSSAQKVVTASFYYGDSDSDKVNLFVTVRYNDGTEQRKDIPASEAITQKEGATPVENGGFKADSNNSLGYAGQGTCHFYDDFVVWSGTDAEFANIESVSVIAYTGNDNEFGGVKVGSGQGVTWVNR